MGPGSRYIGLPRAAKTLKKEVLIMGVVVFKAPKTNVVERVVMMAKRFGEGFMQYADIGFRYVYVPGEEKR